MTKIKLERKDWEEMKTGAIELLKNAMAQVVVYEGQVETAEKELSKFPEEKEEEKKEEKKEDNKDVGKLVEIEKTEEKTAEVSEKALTDKK